MSEKNIISVIHYALYATLFFVPLIFVQHTMFPFIIVKTALFQFLAEIIIFLWIGLCFINKKEYRPRKTPLTIAIFVFLIVMSIASFFGLDPRVSTWSIASRGIGMFALWHFGLLGVALSALGGKMHWKNIFAVSIATSVISALGALISFGGSEIAKFFLSQDTSRPGSTFGNPTFLAGYLLFHIFLALWLAKTEKQEWIRYALFGAALINALAIFRSQTRGDILGLFVGGLAIALFFAMKRLFPFSFRESVLKNKGLFILAGSAIFIALFVSTQNILPWNKVPGLQRLANVNVLGTEVRNRFIAWESGLQAFQDRPLLGWGWENFNLGFQRHYNPALLSTDFGETFWDKPHNVLLEMLVAGGILGILAYLMLWGALLFQVFRLHGKTMQAIFFGMLAAYFVRNLVVFDTVGTYLMFFLVIGYIDFLYSSRNVRTENTHSAQASRSYVFAYASFLPVLLLGYFVNFPVVRAAYIEYDGPNYYLLGKFDESKKAFEKAMEIPQVYKDATRANFASVVKQAEASGVHFPDIENLEKKLVAELEETIKRHPHDYFHYTFLAEFKNQFAGYNPAYLDDAQKLAETARALSPGRQQVYYVQAKTALLRGEKEKAIQIFKEAIELYEGAADPHFYLGLLGYEIGDKALGGAEIARAKELGRIPRTLEEAVALGNLMGDIGGDYKGAAENYELALSSPGDELTKLNIELRLGIALYYAEERGKAITHFLNVLQKTNLKEAPIYNDLLPILQDLGIEN